jgi:RimJ/RimL family protein N-acetyltransferase
MNDLLKGRLLRLSAIDPEEFGRARSGWALDSEYFRLGYSNPTRLHSVKVLKGRLEKDLESESATDFSFTLRTLADDKLIGDIGLEVINWSNRDAFVGLGIGDRQLWSKGYGTDAMSIMLRYAFTELNLRRVSLSVFEYNPRAIRSYEKAGFRHEGRLRQFLSREGRRWDMLFMGILRAEWMKSNGSDDQTN